MSAQSAIKILTTKGHKVPGGTTCKIANNLIYRLLAIFHSTQIVRVTYKVTYWRYI